MLFMTILLLALTNLLTVVTANHPDAHKSGVHHHYDGPLNTPHPDEGNITLVSGAPHLAARSSSVAGVYRCDKSDWKGTCLWQQASGGACHPISYTRAASFGPDMNMQCAIYQNSDCTGDDYSQLTWPGTAQLGSYAAWWGNNIKSFKCRWCYGCIYGNAPYW